MSILAGKVAIVTGAGRGIGQACAVQLAQAGAHVMVNDLAEPEETLNKISAVGGHGTSAVADVSDRAAVEALIRRIADDVGRIDILVTNAAFSERELFYKASMQGFEKTINVCMWGPYYFLHYASQIMINHGEGGSVVCISSPHAVKAIPGAMAYNMAKAAVDQMARTAAVELAEHRIRVNVVHPGWTDTPGERKFFDESVLQVKGNELPWGRLAHPDEIARGVLFLCDPASEYVNGSTLTIDSGALLPHDQMFRVKQ